MKERVYVLFDVHVATAKEVSRTLARKLGVVSADILEDQSEVMVVIEAGGRQQNLAEEQCKPSPRCKA